MNETELEKLVVRLVGDASLFIKAMEETKKKAGETESFLKRLTEGVKGHTESIEGFGKVLEKSLMAAGISFGFHEILENYEQFEKNTIRLEAILEANGRDVDATMERYNKFAKTIQDTTSASKYQAKALLESAETFGLTGSEAEKAAKEALAVSKVIKGMDAESIMRISKAFASGDLSTVKMFTRFIPQLRGITNELELQEKWDKLVAAGTRVMGREMETAGGQIEKAKQRMAIFTKEIGGVLAEGIQPATKFLGEMAESFSKLSPETRATVAEIAAATAGLIALNAVLPIVIGQLGNLKNNWKGMAFVGGTIAIVEITKELYSMSAAGQRAEEQLNKTKAAMEHLSTHVGSGAAEQQAAKERMRELTKMLGESFEETDNKSWYNRSLNELTGKGSERTRLIQKQIDELRESMTRAAEPVEKAGKSFGSIFTTMLDAAGRIAKDVQDLPIEVAKTTNEWRTQLATIGMTAEEVEIYKLKLKDLSPEDEKMLRAQGVLLELRRKDQEALEKMQQDAQALQEKYKDPMEKFIDRQQELTNMFNKGMIGARAYAMALEDAKKQLQGLTAASRDAAEYGADAVSRMGEYMEKMGFSSSQQFQQAAAAAKAGGAPAAVSPFTQAISGPINFGVIGNQLIDEMKKVNEKLAGPGVKVVKMGPIF